MDLPTFRAQYPAFADPAKYPDATVSLWLTTATNSLPADRWGSLLDLGIGLYVAHNLALDRRANIEGAFGGAPGQMTGPLNAKQVKDVSAGYDTAAATEVDGGHWNLTTYGARFLNYARMAGMGGFYAGAGDDCGPMPGLAALPFGAFNFFG